MIVVRGRGRTGESGQSGGDAAKINELSDYYSFIILLDPQLRTDPSNLGDWIPMASCRRNPVLGAATSAWIPDTHEF